MKSIILGMIFSDKGDVPIGRFPVNRTGMIQVRQRCDNCEKHIEMVAKTVDGVKKAEWNKNSNVLIVDFDSQTTNVNKIEMTIAEAGHDTSNYKGNIKFYAQMPPCCKYREELNEGKI